MNIEALKILKKIYGYDSFRKGQNYIIMMCKNKNKNAMEFLRK